MQSQYNKNEQDALAKLSPEAKLQLARERGLIPQSSSAEPGITDILKSSLAGGIKGIEQTGANILSAPGALANQLLGTKFQPVQVPESIDPTKQWQLSRHPLALAAQGLPQLTTPVISNLLAQHYIGGRLPATAGIPTRAASSFGIGYATTPGMEKEKTLGGLASAVIPTVAGITTGGIGRRVAGLSRERHAEYAKNYNKLFEQAENLPGNQNLRVPTAFKTDDAKRVIKGIGSKYKESLERFIQNPTLRNAHDAQSDINSGIRALNNKASSGSPLTKNEQFSIEHGQDYIARLRGEMMRNLTDRGAPELAENYGKLTRGYAREIGPLKFKEAEVARKDKKKISTAKVGKAALQQEPILRESGIAQQIPGYLMRQRLEPVMPLLKNLGLAGGIGAGLELGAGYLPSYLSELMKSVSGR
jgi:hypothetical protein